MEGREKSVLVISVLVAMLSGRPLSASDGRGQIDRWAEAMGGRERIAAVHSTYREATIEVAGYHGTIRVWHTADGKYRKEEQVGPLAIVETFDGTGGSVRERTSPSRLMSPEENRRARSQAFANWNAVYLAFFPERSGGSVSLEEDGTIVLQPADAIERRVILDPVTWLPTAMTHVHGGRTITVTFTAYETVDGITFEREIHRSNGDPRFDAVIRFTRTEINVPVDEVRFAEFTSP